MSRARANRPSDATPAALAAGALAGGLAALAPRIASDHDLSAAELGLLLAAPGAGALAARLARGARPGRVEASVALVLAALALAVGALATSGPALWIALALAGGAIATAAPRRLDAPTLLIAAAAAALGVPLLGGASAEPGLLALAATVYATGLARALLPAAERAPAVAARHDLDARLRVGGGMLAAGCATGLAALGPLLLAQARGLDDGQIGATLACAALLGAVAAAVGASTAAHARARGAQVAGACTAVLAAMAAASNIGTPHLTAILLAGAVAAGCATAVLAAPGARATGLALVGGPIVVGVVATASGWTAALALASGLGALAWGALALGASPGRPAGAPPALDSRAAIGAALAAAAATREDRPDA